MLWGLCATFDSGERVDASGELADGTRLDGPAGLRRVLIEKSDVFRTAFTEKLLTYAVGTRRRESRHAGRALDRALGGTDESSLFCICAWHREQPAVSVSTRGCGGSVAVTARPARHIA